MRSTEELRTELTTFTAIVQESLGPRVRVQRDAEGCPFVQGRTGRLEWRGLGVDGTARVYAFTDRAKMIAKLLAIPGVHRHQIGDQEAVGWIAAEDRAALRAVAALFHTRIRRIVTEAMREAGREASRHLRGPAPGSQSAPPSHADPSGKAQA
jgi:hypothetical protein